MPSAPSAAEDPSDSADAGQQAAPRVPAEPAAIDPAARSAKRAFSALSASSIGLELGISVLIGLLCGKWLDQRFGTSPWLLLLLLVLGLVAGFRNVLRAVKRVERESKTP